MTKPQPKLAVLVKGWPRLSETFIAQELVALQEAGHSFDIWSLRHPTDVKRHPLHDRFRGQVHYLPEYLYQEPSRVWAARQVAQTLPGYAGGLPGLACRSAPRSEPITASAVLVRLAFWLPNCPTPRG